MKSIVCHFFVFLMVNPVMAQLATLDIYAVRQVVFDLNDHDEIGLTLSLRINNEFPMPVELSNLHVQLTPQREGSDEPFQLVLPSIRMEKMQFKPGKDNTVTLPRISLGRFQEETVRGILEFLNEAGNPGSGFGMQTLITGSLAQKLPVGELELGSVRVEYFLQPGKIAHGLLPLEPQPWRRGIQSESGPIFIQGVQRVRFDLNRHKHLEATLDFLVKVENGAPFEMKEWMANVTPTRFDGVSELELPKLTIHFPPQKFHAGLPVVLAAPPVDLGEINRANVKKLMNLLNSAGDPDVAFGFLVSASGQRQEDGNPTPQTVQWTEAISLPRQPGLLFQFQ
jgi:hypothetical protein